MRKQSHLLQQRLRAIPLQRARHHILMAVTMLLLLAVNVIMLVTDTFINVPAEPGASIPLPLKKYIKINDCRGDTPPYFVLCL